mgnify:CR=1 FL=1
MNLCTQIPVSERCDGCPLTDFESEIGNLEPYEELTLNTKLTELLGQQTESSTKKDYIHDQQAVVVLVDLVPEPPLVPRIANWKMVGACDYHEGPVIEDREAEARFRELVSKLIKGE